MSPRLLTAVNQLLILPWNTEPKTARAGPGGTGMSTMSRGRLNIATRLVAGSIETTIIVSVLNVPSFGRWSTPRRRMLSRSVPFQGGAATDGAAEPSGGRLAAGVPEAPAPAGEPASPTGVVSPQVPP